MHWSSRWSESKKKFVPWASWAGVVASRATNLDQIGKALALVAKRRVRVVVVNMVKKMDEKTRVRFVGAGYSWWMVELRVTEH